jgi:hypothetical protein
MGNGEEEHAALHVAVMNGIPNGARSQAHFAARDFPGGLLDSGLSDQVVIELPAQDEAGVKAAKRS